MLSPARNFFGLLLSVVLSTSFAGAQTSAFTPANPPEMKPLSNPHSPANETAAHFMRGVNFGNYLEIAAGARWGAHITTNDFDAIQSEGFDHIRVPIAWQNYAGPAPDYKLSSEIFDKVDFVLTNALSRHLAVMLNIHHFDNFTADPTNYTAEFIALWRQISTHYAALPDTVVFELLNEPMGAAKTEVMNPIYAKVISVIRETNPRRTIVVSPANWGNVHELKNLVLPAGDDNLLVTVHCYEPFYFTHQGAGWAGPDVKPLRGIQFPGPPATPIVPDPNLRSYMRKWIEQYNTLPTDKNPSSRAAFAGLMKYAHDWAAYYGRPVYVGEFGAYTHADPVSRANFYRDFRKVLAEEKIGWAIWDWDGGFNYWNPRKNEPLPGMREALFGK
jgi:endoglucanase